MRYLTTFVSVLALATTLSAQSPSTETRFEAASVKRDTSGQLGIMTRTQGTTFFADHITLRQLLQTAYGFRFLPTGIVGGPSWIGADQFQITATMADARGDSNAMLRNLLADRFGVRSHIEDREQPVYELVLARADGRLGPKLSPTRADCNVERCGFGSTGPNFQGKATTIRELIGGALFAAAGRRIVDQTGLSEKFDIELKWDAQGIGRAPNGVAPPEVRSDGVTIFTAVEEQLGLKLRSSKQMVPVLVIDSAKVPEAD